MGSRSNGFLRKVATNEIGSFSIGGLPIGVYEVTVRKDGFRAERFGSLELVVGQIRTLNVRMQVAAGAQEINVEAAAAPLAESSAEVGGVILSTQVANLPLNGRNWSSLMALAAGAIDSGGANQKTIRFAGHGTDDSNFCFDGVDATGINNPGREHQFSSSDFH